MLSFIAERAAEDAPALVRPGGEQMSYATLAMASAAVMQAVGERVGDVARRIVAVAVEEGAGFVASVLALLEAGAVVLPLDPRRGLAALEVEAARARALAVIVGDPADDRLEVVAVDASRRELVPEACLLVEAGGRRAVHSRAGLGVGVDAIVHQVGLDARSRLPLVGALGDGPLLTTALATLRAGGSLLLVGALGPEAQAAAATALGANVVAGTMAALRPLANATVGRVVVSGAAFDLPALRAAFPAARIARALDTGEALRVAAAEEDAPWSALDGVELRFDGEVAEVRAATAMLGYFDDAEATRAALVADDAGGAAWVRAYPIDRIDTGALERTIGATAGVREAALLAVRAGTGERLYAFVAGDATAVPRHPARVIALESLPRRPDGAVDREALRRMVTTD